MSTWYKQSFGKDYLLVYKHRNIDRAYQEVKQMMGWLELLPGASVFDLCCGMGRHSLALADFGYRVTGLDLSEVLLAEARKQDTEGKVTWLNGDMRCVPLNGHFDAVINLFTSFGYFEHDEENGRVLKEIARLLKPGGKYIIDFLNPSFVALNLVPYSERSEGGVLIKETRYIEGSFVKKSIVLQDGLGPDRTYQEQVKLYGLSQFLQMLPTSLSVDHTYGHYDASSYVKDTSPRLILIGHRKE
jgi:ubiquinone/menaquinone biosynthesis C-methylase UbiE